MFKKKVFVYNQQDIQNNVKIIIWYSLLNLKFWNSILNFKNQQIVFTLLLCQAKKSTIIYGWNEHLASLTAISTFSLMFYWLKACVKNLNTVGLLNFPLNFFIIYLSIELDKC